MGINIFSCLLLICVTVPFAFSHWSQQSIKSWAFESVRPKHPPKNISAECGSVVTEPYGLLEKTYKRGEVEEGSSCIVILRAPANHVVNIISVAFDFADRTLDHHDLNDYSGSNLILRDPAAPINYQILAQYTVSDNQRNGGAFVTSSSRKEDLFVDITYHDYKVNAIQKIFIKYEFLNVDDMNRLLRENNLQ